MARSTNDAGRRRRSNGRGVLFWKDRWIAGRTATEIAAAVVGAVPTRRKNRRVVAEALQENSWVMDIVRVGAFSASDCGWKSQIFNETRRSLTDSYGHVQPRENNLLKTTTRCFVVGTYARAPPLQSGDHVHPLRSKIFGWLAVRYWLWTSDMRVRHGRRTRQRRASPVPVLQEEDNVDHILAQCVYTRQV